MHDGILHKAPVHKTPSCTGLKVGMHYLYCRQPSVYIVYLSALSLPSVLPGCPVNLSLTACPVYSDCSSGPVFSAYLLAPASCPVYTDSSSCNWCLPFRRPCLFCLTILQLLPALSILPAHFSLAASPSCPVYSVCHLALAACPAGPVFSACESCTVFICLFTA